MPSYVILVIYVRKTDCVWVWWVWIDFYLIQKNKEGHLYLFKIVIVVMKWGCNLYMTVIITYTNGRKKAEATGAEFDAWSKSQGHGIR